MKVKLYIKGFLKGLLFLLLIEALIAIFHFIVLGDVYPHINYSLKYNLIFWLIGVLSMNYLITKYRFHKGWSIGSIFLTFYLLPFLFGSLEISKRKKH
jgi:hypothetical protein